MAQVHGCGSNAVGQLGIQGCYAQRNQTKPVLLQGLKDKHVTQISVGARFAFFLTADGDCFGLGDNCYGQLGLGPAAEWAVSRPSQVTAPSLGKVRLASCGDRFGYLVDDSGSVFACGANDFGQLGLGHSKDTPTPQRVEALSEAGGVSAIACGAGFMWCQLEGAGLRSAGSNESGKLGIGPLDGIARMGGSYPHPQKVCFDGVVESLSCGSHHVYMTAEGGAKV